MHARAISSVRAMLIVGLVALVAACSGGAGVLSTVGNSVGETGVAAPPAPSAAPAVGGPAFGRGVGESDGASGGDASAPDGRLTAVVDEAAIVKTGSLAVEVDDLDAALVKAHGAVSGVGGFVAASDETRDSDQPVAAVTYRIPAARWDDALSALRDLGKPLSERTNAIEVTGQLVDLKARISNLRSTEAALQAIMTKATKISDILDVQQQLTQVQGQIEELAGQQTHLQDQATYGTLTVTWTVEAPPAVSVTSDKWEPAAEVDRAVASLIGALEVLARVGIWLGIVGLPLIGSLLLLLGLGLFVVRRLVSRPAAAPSLPSMPEAPGA